MDSSYHCQERRFLEQFPEARRSLIASFFYAAVRQGIVDPPEVVTFVRGEVQRRCAKWAMSQSTDGLRREQALRDEVVGALNGDPDAALAFAGHVVEREALPPAEQTRLKEERGAHYRTQWMQSKPPTEKQLSYLRALGYTGPQPASQQEASAAIDALKKAGS